jgi:hypothetical protein
LVPPITTGILACLAAFLGEILRSPRQMNALKNHHIGPITGYLRIQL